MSPVGSARGAVSGTPSGTSIGVSKLSSVSVERTVVSGVC